MYGNESYGGVLYTASFEDIMSLPSFIANFNGGGLDFAEWPSGDRCGHCHEDSRNDSKGVELHCLLISGVANTMEIPTSLASLAFIPSRIHFQKPHPGFIRQAQIGRWVTAAYTKLPRSAAPTC